jgi:hypothetical protein
MRGSSENGEAGVTAEGERFLIGWGDDSSPAYLGKPGTPSQANFSF